MVTTAAAAGPAASLSGLWILKSQDSTIKPAAQGALLTAEGTPVPLQPAAAALYRQRVAEGGRNSGRAQAMASCLPLGMPLMMAAGGPIQILQTPTQVTMLFEEQRTYRIVSLGGSQPADPDPMYYGNSVGHFEGSVLVVDTIGLNDQTALDAIGMPHSAALHLNERIRRVDANTLEDAITVDDPGTFTRPWTMRQRYVAFRGTMKEGVCESQ